MTRLFSTQTEQPYKIMMLKGGNTVVKLTYKTDAERVQILNSNSDKTLIEDARRTNENYLLLIDTGETEPYILIPQETEFELLQEQVNMNAGAIDYILMNF